MGWKNNIEAEDSQHAGLLNGDGIGDGYGYGNGDGYGYGYGDSYGYGCGNGYGTVVTTSRRR